MTQTRTSPAGIVLCGGRSRRMGRPKERLELLGEAMLARVVRRLGEVAKPIVVAGAAEQVLPSLPEEVLIARDERPDGGPLEGFRSGLRVLAERRHAASDLVALVACDVPLLDADAIERLAEILRADVAVDAIVPRTGDLVHPLCAVYRVGVLTQVERLVAEGRLKMRGLLDELSVRYVEDAGEWLANVNAPEEFERVRERVERSRE